MSSKMRHTAQILLVILTASSLFTACDKFLGKEKKKPETLVITPKELKCLQTWPEKVKAFLDDQATDKQTDEVFTCLQTAMTTFAKFAKGESASQFSSSELVHYLNRYMIKEYQLTEDFMKELMKLKVFFIGGSSTSMTRSEIEIINKDLDILREEAQKLRGRIQILSFAADPKFMTESRIVSTQDLTRATLDRLIDVSKVADSTYEWGDFEEFLHQLDLYLRDSQTTQMIQKWYPLANAVRKVFIGERTEIRTVRDFKSVGSWIVDAFGLVARYYYLIREQSLDEKQLWTRSMKLAESVLGVMEKSPAIMKIDLLSADAIDEAIDQLSKLKVLKVDLNAMVIKNAYRNVIAHVIKGPRYGRIDGSAVRGLDRLDLDFLRGEYNSWKSVQLALLNTFSDRSSLPLQSVIEATQKIKVEEFFKQVGAKPDQIPTLTKTWADWVQILNLKYPILWDSQFKMQIPLRAEQNAQNRITFSSLSSLNLLRSFVRFVLLGYGQGPTLLKTQANVWDLYLTEEKMIQFEEDFRQLGRALKLLDPRTPEAPKRTFLEGNYFPFSTNGDGKLTSIEMLEQFSILFSAGLGTANGILKEAIANGCSTKADDVFGMKTLNESCFFQFYEKNFNRFYENMPHLTQQVKTGQINFHELYQLLMAIALVKDKQQGTVEYAEIRTMSVVMHYVESLMTVYDKDRNGYLSEKELMNAYPRFQMVVDKLNPMSSVLPSETAFLYIVVRGDIPDTSDLSGKIDAALDLSGFVAFEDIDSKKINRGNLLKVIALIKKIAAKNQEQQKQ